MKVAFKDRDEKVEFFHLALKTAGIGFDYTYADLIYQIHEKIKKTGGEGTINDIVKLKIAWEEKWEQYEKSKKK